MGPEGVTRTLVPGSLAGARADAPSDPNCRRLEAALFYVPGKQTRPRAARTGHGGSAVKPPAGGDRQQGDTPVSTWHTGSWTDDVEPGGVEALFLRLVRSRRGRCRPHLWAERLVQGLRAEWRLSGTQRLASPPAGTGAKGSPQRHWAPKTGLMAPAWAVDPGTWPARSPGSGPERTHVHTGWQSQRLSSSVGVRGGVQSLWLNPKAVSGQTVNGALPFPHLGAKDAGPPSS